MYHGFWEKEIKEFPHTLHELLASFNTNSSVPSNRGGSKISKTRVKMAQVQYLCISIKFSLDLNLKKNVKGKIWSF